VTPAELAAAYFESWQARDVAALRQVLADDVSFRGPLGTADGADACIQGLSRMASIMTRVVVQKVFADGDDVLTWFELHTSVAAPVPVANWMHAEAGRIARIRVAFDARGFAPPAGAGR
jgi:ketosteroid isomerase-like protein